MSRLAVLALPGNEVFASRLAEALGAERLKSEWRRFPDGETYFRMDSPIVGRHVLIVCTLSRPDPQFLGLVYAARTVRALGAVRVTLVAPYLAYMRQDKAFRPGETVTSGIFADLISREFDALVTVDPHLHRHKSLDEIYRLSVQTLHAAPLLGRWICENIPSPLIIGPDEESRQWAAEVAGAAGAPFEVLAKTRLGDRDVRIEAPDLDAWRDRTVVLVDDIVSSAQTLIEAAHQLSRQGFGPPVCVVVHAVFARSARARLSEVSHAIISTDSVADPSNEISLVDLFASACVAGA